MHRPLAMSCFELAASTSAAAGPAGHPPGGLLLHRLAASNSSASPSMFERNLHLSEGNSDGSNGSALLPPLDLAEQPAFAPPDGPTPTGSADTADEGPPVPVVFLGKAYSAIPAGRPTLAPHALYLAQVGAAPPPQGPPVAPPLPSRRRLHPSSPPQELGLPLGGRGTEADTVGAGPQPGSEWERVARFADAVSSYNILQVRGSSAGASRRLRHLPHLLQHTRGSAPCKLGLTCPASLPAGGGRGRAPRGAAGARAGRGAGAAQGGWVGRGLGRHHAAGALQADGVAGRQAVAAGTQPGSQRPSTAAQAHTPLLPVPSLPRSASQRWLGRPRLTAAPTARPQPLGAGPRWRRCSAGRPACSASWRCPGS